ncbi:hypothetical protein DXG01_004638 [Tephrocybe rancida]|nr:hypothetical protein DXG01_004638 [Tephrocybe rancida]
MVNPGTFQSTRKHLLLSKKTDYACAVTENCVADFLADLQHGYFKCFGVGLNLKPTVEELECVDDSMADPEPAVPDRDILSDGEYTEAMRQIKWWMAYQYWKDCEHSAKDTGVQEAFLALLQQLTGKGFPKPCCITAYNHWQSLPDNRALVDNKVATHMDLLTLQKNHARICTKVVSELFSALPTEVQEEWKGVSKEQHALALVEWTHKTEGLEESPEACQTFVTVLFMQRILDLVSGLTGMKTTFMLGSPEPVDGGRLNIISVHSGHTPGDVKMNFWVSEWEYHQKLIVPVFSKFLKKCYTIEEDPRLFLTPPRLWHHSWMSMQTKQA